MIEDMADESRDDDLLGADQLARQLYSEAVYTLATSPADLRTRIHDAYTGRAIHANMIVRLLPAPIGERVHLLAGRLGTHPDATTEEAAHAVWQSLLDQGVLIRVTGPAGWLRVSIGTPEENDMFRRALATAVDAP